MKIKLDRKLNRGSKQIAKSVAEMMIKHFDIDIWHLDILITEYENVEGLTLFADGYARVEIASHLRGCDLISTMIHEMVHVWQHARGDFESSESGFTWKGIEFKIKSTEDMINLENSQYRALPWEAEAYTLEEQFMQELNFYLTSNDA